MCQFYNSVIPLLRLHRMSLKRGCLCTSLYGVIPLQIESFISIKILNEGVLLITENWADMSAFNWHGTAMCTEVLKLMS